MNIIKDVEVKSQSILDEVVQKGAERMLQSALEAEVESFIERHKMHKDESGHREVVRNGYLPARHLQTGTGRIKIKQPRVLDKRAGKRYISSILPPYMRRTPSLNNLIPCLYLKGVSTGQMESALRAILGDEAKNLSASVVSRLKEGWIQEYQSWEKRDLSHKRYVYIWADAVYFNVRLDTDRPCILVMIGTLEDGSKELIAIVDGQRESTLSWKEILRDLKKRGLSSAPKLAIGDGALGFWAALAEEFPETKPQRCWVHKTANVLNKLPKKVQHGAKKHLHDIYMAPTKEDAFKALDDFQSFYSAKYPKACQCLIKDKDVLFHFYDFPAEHWQHLRTTNPIESLFATVRHRTRQTKGCGSKNATLSMVFKLSMEAQKKWRKIRGYRWIPMVLDGAIFSNGELKAAA